MCKGDLSHAIELSKNDDKIGVRERIHDVVKMYDFAHYAQNQERLDAAMSNVTCYGDDANASTFGIPEHNPGDPDRTGHGIIGAKAQVEWHQIQKQLCNKLHTLKGCGYGEACKFRHVSTPDERNGYSNICIRRMNQDVNAEPLPKGKGGVKQKVKGTVRAIQF